MLKEAYDSIEDQEDEHLYHSKGYCRELWLESLGIPALIPPPEEVRQVKTAIGAAKAEQAGDKQRPGRVIWIDLGEQRASRTQAGLRWCCNWPNSLRPLHR